MLHDAVDESEIDVLMWRGNEVRVNMSQRASDSRHSYCPIRDKLQCTSTATVLRIANT